MSKEIIIDNLVYEIETAENGEVLAWLTRKKKSNLKEIRIPSFISDDNQEYKVFIDYEHFDILSDIESITIEENNPCYKMSEDCLYSKDMKLLFWVSPKVKNYTMPDSVTWYSPYSFLSAKSIDELTFSPALKEIYRLELKNCWNLQSLIFPEGIKKICEEAFENCLSLQSVTFPKSLRIIKRSAFAGCKNLSSVCFQDGLKVIQEEAFRETHLERIALPSSLICIGQSAFSNCLYLEKVSLPENLLIIRDQAFWDCQTLTDIYIPSKVKVIGKEVFAHCRNLVNFTVAEDNESYSGNETGLFDKEKTILFRASNRKHLVFPKSLTQMVYMAFSNCDQHWDKIESIEISNRLSVDNGKHCLSAIPTLKNITVGPGTTDLISLDGVLYSSDLKELIFCPQKKQQVIIPEGVEEITDEAFQSCNIRSLKLPDSVKRIGTAAFRSCRNLTVVSLPTSLTSMGESCFDYCERLKISSIPEGITDIKDRTFFRCQGINSNDIFRSVRDIERCGFQGCGFTDLVIPGNVKKIGWDTFKACPNLKSLRLEEGVEIIVHGAFCNNHELRSVYLPSSIKVLGNGSFACCEKLESITISSLTPPQPDYDGDHVRFFPEKLYPSLKLFVPEKGIEAYRKHSVWGKVQNILPLTDLSIIGQD